MWLNGAGAAFKEPVDLIFKTSLQFNLVWFYLIRFNSFQQLSGRCWASLVCLDYWRSGPQKTTWRGIDLQKWRLIHRYINTQPPSEKEEEAESYYYWGVSLVFCLSCWDLGVFPGRGRIHSCLTSNRPRPRELRLHSSLETCVFVPLWS